MSYARNVLVGLDQLGNALLGGDPDETLSSRLHRARLGEFGPRVRVLSAPVRWLVDATARIVFRQTRHCEASFEPDEGRDDLLRR